MSGSCVDKTRAFHDINQLSLISYDLEFSLVKAPTSHNASELFVVYNLHDTGAQAEQCETFYILLQSQLTG